MTSHRLTLGAFLHQNGLKSAMAPALWAARGNSLSHLGLFQQVERTMQSLNHQGVGRNDRVAIVLPQGPELALAFLAVASCATAAPLNHAYQEKDFLFYLGDLNARCLIVGQGDNSPARSAAEKLNVPIVEVVPDPDGNGLFQVSGKARDLEGKGGFAEAEDVALILHTSGTTSRPKMVPLTHGNLCSSASNIGKTLQLGPEDRCLTLMPLFHIHGLVACVLAPLQAGGSTVVPGAFTAEAFAGWLHTWQPTWFSAVPTMHQAILDRIQKEQYRPLPGALRLIRSSSAALPPPVMTGLEEAFAVPVIESYGMTEAAHQMASNPLPPLTRKPGSVGLAAGPEICILGEGGECLGQGATGEIAIRGQNVTPGYENNPEANQANFCNGWFRTGDQGYLDEAGYLFLTGRLKELINRGGEKIAPRDIDEALLAHPEVRQAVGFAVPHASLGEDVAAAVLLTDGSSLDEAALRAFALSKLPAFKAPSRILILDDIPKGPTGKLQRIGLAEKLADALAVGFEPPKGELEHLLATTMEGVLGQTGLGRNDNFFARGGDSLRSIQVISRLNESLDLQLPLTLLFELPTPALLAVRLEEILSNREVELLAQVMDQLSSEEQKELLGDDFGTP